MISVFTLSCLLTGMVYPNSWACSRLPRVSLALDNKITWLLICHNLSAARHPATSLPISRSVAITMVLKSNGRPSTCGPVAQADNTVPALRTPRHIAWCAMFGHVWHHARAAPRVCGYRRTVRAWLPAQATTDASTWGSK